MEIAALILSIIALLASLACLVLMLAKNFFSKHTLTYVDPLKDMKDMTEPGQIGNNMFDQFRDLGDPIDSEELDQIERLRNRKLNK